MVTIPQDFLKILLNAKPFWQRSYKIRNKKSGV